MMSMASGADSRIWSTERRWRLWIGGEVSPAGDSAVGEGTSFDDKKTPYWKGDSVRGEFNGPIGSKSDERTTPSQDAAANQVPQKMNSAQGLRWKAQITRPPAERFFGAEGSAPPNGLR